MVTVFTLSGQITLHLIMVCRLPKLLLLIVIICCCKPGNLAGQSPGLSRIWAVKDGLPQSFISGIFQDKDGFLWISTLNGFCRGDGRTFKYFRHTYADSSGLGSNIILHLFDAGNNQLLLCYIDGRMDLFNTVTEQVIPLWKNKAFDVLRSETHWFKSLVKDHHGTGWMMAHDGGVFRLDLHGQSVKHYSLSELQLSQPVLGLAVRGDSLLLFTETRLFVRDNTGKAVRNISYPFQSLHLFKTGNANIYSPAMRANGDMLIPYADGIRIWNIETGFFKSVLFARNKVRAKLIDRFDHNGNYYFECDSNLYLLRPDNSLTKWPLINPAVEGIITSMCIDRSGVLWAGTNGYGLRQYNLLKTGMDGYKYQHSFVIDVLDHYTPSSAPVAGAGTFLNRSVAFANRCVSFHDSVWITDVNQQWTQPTLTLFANHRVSELTFRNEDKLSVNGPTRIMFLAFTPSGVLWGIDQHFSLIRFNIQQRTFRVLQRIALDPAEELNGMTADGESAFYITTTRNLVRVDSLGQMVNLTSLLPSKELLTVSKDHDDGNILWIGTLSDGLIRLDRTTQRTQVFSMATGLPNNTIYSALEGSDHQLWCSSNKGIFAFNKQLHTAQSFTSSNGLPDNEFNRFYYMEMPGGDLAFGGPMGYTIFNPSKLETDNFDPPITLTGMEVINRPRQDSVLRSLSALHLRYDQNSITAEFAAMQFDFPEKLQYRHMLEGFDKTWIMTGNDNKVYYTNLPPGRYTLLLNASNTSGKWSKHVRRIQLIITPPFWRTWWFYTVAILLVGLMVYLFLQQRISSLKKEHRQQLQFERKAMELEAMALRARMNPHFIFNCLNSIKALIQEKEDKKAIAYLTSFVTLIRKQLSHTSDKTTLQEELDTCRLYLRLEAMRFDDRIAYEFDIADNVLPQQVMVPPLILQPIIENAVVHGLIPMEQGGLVSVRVYREGRYVICSIEDNGIGRVASAAQQQRSSRLHESKGVRMLEERIYIQNRLHEWSGSMETTDLYEGGKSCGTRVMLKFDTGL
jgi:ligand-binding sensor domain-containing protein